MIENVWELDQELEYSMEAFDVIPVAIIKTSA